MHDPRIGRFFAIDPLAKRYAHNSPYAFSENRVLDGVELEGLEYVSVNDAGVDPEAHKNDDGTYSFSLGEKAFENVTMEKIDGQDYFRLGQDMSYTAKKGWSGGGRKKNQLTSGLDPHKEYSVGNYTQNIWPAKYGQEMTEAQQKSLENGCIGVSEANLNLPGTAVPTHGYSTVEKAREMAGLEKENIKKFPGLYRENARPVIYSMRFYSDSPDGFVPNERGVVDMSDYNSDARRNADSYNFDFGYQDEISGRYWHANHRAPGMKVYESTLEYYSKPQKSFNRQIFVVGTTNNPIPNE